MAGQKEWELRGGWGQKEMKHSVAHVTLKLLF